jgi:hypothetical protein
MLFVRVWKRTYRFFFSSGIESFKFCHALVFPHSSILIRIYVFCVSVICHRSSYVILDRCIVWNSAKMRNADTVFISQRGETANSFLNLTEQACPRCTAGEQSKKMKSWARLFSSHLSWPYKLADLIIFLAMILSFHPCFPFFFFLPSSHSSFCVHLLSRLCVPKTREFRERPAVVVERVVGCFCAVPNTIWRSLMFYISRLRICRESSRRREWSRCLNFCISSYVTSSVKSVMKYFMKTKVVYLFVISSRLPFHRLPDDPLARTPSKDYRCEDDRFPVSSICVTISNNGTNATS